MPGAVLSEPQSEAVEVLEDTAVTDPEVSSNPSTYYNGRRWAEKHGHPESRDSSPDRSD